MAITQRCETTMPKTKEERLDVMTQRMAMWQMRIAGKTPPQIAAEFGVSVRYVQYELRDAVQMIDATKWLEIETQTDLDRLERLFSAYWPLAIGAEPDQAAAMLILKILEQKAKLLGLNAPKRVDISLLIETWAKERGLDMRDVIDVTGDLFPKPEISK